MAIRLYDVTTRWGDQECSHPVSAVSASAARYRAFLEADLSGSFADFLKRTRVRLRTAPLDDDGYGYVRRAYGVDVRVGQRVGLRNEGPEWNGREGEVVYPGGSTAHVHVQFDGIGCPLIVHPSNVVPAPSPPATPVSDGRR